MSQQIHHVEWKERVDSTIETPEMFSDVTIKIPELRHSYYLWAYYAPCCSVSVVD